MIAKPAAMPGTCGARNATPPATIVNTSRGHSRLRRIAPGWCSGSAVLTRALESSRAMGGLISARLPSRSPMSAASTHQPTTIGTRVSSEWVAAASTETVASTVAAPPLSRTVVLRKSTKRTPLQQCLEHFPHPRRALDRQIGLLGQLGGDFVGAHGGAHHVAQPPRLH